MNPAGESVSNLQFQQVVQTPALSSIASDAAALIAPDNRNDIQSSPSTATVTTQQPPQTASLPVQVPVQLPVQAPIQAPVQVPAVPVQMPVPAPVPVPVSATVTEKLKETSPQGRYVKLDDRLGSGAYKDVYRAYDTNEGIMVAWNVVKLARVPPRY